MKLKRVFTVKLILRTIIAFICGAAYLLNPANLDFSAEHKWIGLYIVWVMIMIDFINRFIPGKLHPIGMQKHLKRNFEPTEAYVSGKGLSDSDKKQKKRLNQGALKVFIFYILLNALWGVLFWLQIFRAQELFLIMLVYYVGDMICANGFCPFRLLFMKNRCCNVCRIYNWDAIMLVLPLLFVPGFYAYSLGVVAIVYTILWEVSFYKHPERFLEGCNQKISCKNCKHGMCPRRYPWNK